MTISPRELERILLSAYWGNPEAARSFALLLTTGFVVQADSGRATEFFMFAVKRGGGVPRDPAEGARDWSTQNGAPPDD